MSNGQKQQRKPNAAERISALENALLEMNEKMVGIAEVIDNNEFIASIFVKPARSINYITLNFVAVRTGVSFEEVVGSV